VAGGWWLVAGGWWLVAGGWWLVAGGWWLGSLITFPKLVYTDHLALAATMRIEKLTREAFAPFGDVITLDGVQHYSINDGMTERFHDLASVDVSDQTGKPLISLFRSKPRALPFEVKVMERHPLGSQAFFPLSKLPYLVIVAAPGKFDERSLRLFLARQGEGVNYAKGAWHHGLFALYAESDFIVVDRGGPGVNCDEVFLTQSIVITEEAVREVGC
jgi:ureidoglycolate lyase